MAENLKDTSPIWIPILISILSLGWAIFNSIKTNKALKDNNEWRKGFEIYREENRQNDEAITKHLAEKNTRTSIVPYFNIVLKDDRIKKVGSDLNLEIGFMNIGKESATNIQLSPLFPEKGLEGYFKSEAYPQNQYDVLDYLNQFYAMPKEEVTFKIKVKIAGGIMNDFIKFKIIYSDLIGNKYEQEFRFGFYLNESIGFNLDNHSYEPKLLND